MGLLSWNINFESGDAAEILTVSWFVFAAGLLREFKDGSEDACRNPESQGTFIEEIEDNRHCRHRHRHRHRRLQSHLQSQLINLERSPCSN